MRGLIKALYDEDQDIGYAAAEALGRIGDTQAVEPLLVVLKDESKFVCEAAAAALEKIGSLADTATQA